MNDADAQRVGAALSGLGFCGRAEPEEADLIVLITCVVRQSAEDKTIGRLESLKGLKRRHPSTMVAVMGCLVADPATLRERFPWVDGFFRPSDVDGLVDLVRQRFAPETAPALPAERTPVSVSIPISMGCDHHCTYCIVRLRRGSQQSRPAGEILRETREAVQRGAREIVLLGQNVDAYGHDLPSQGLNLAGLLSQVHDTDGLLRLRFLTSHPGEMTEELISAVAGLSRVCPHLELPVQCGDDVVLRRMGRGYTREQYSSLLSRIRQRVPGCSIATDIIVGFPTETREQFEATADLVTAERFDSVHIAKYSPRPGTPAALLADDVPQDEKERRHRILEELQTRISQEINSTYMGRTVEVLVEGRHRGRWRGRSATNKLVFFDHDADWMGELASVEINWAGPWSLRGTVKG
jgi:tRNA-2-methylthio-N6-dimethylallyladenosine synthase